MVKVLRKIWHYYRINFVLDLKAKIAYPGSFWVAFWTIPMWALIQIMFIETVYGQVDYFLGYDKWQNYILFGTYKIVQSLAVTLFMVQLDELPSRVRGEDNWSLDVMLLKPIDSQIFVTMGRFWFGSLGAMAVGGVMLSYGWWHQGKLLCLGSLLAYLSAVILGVWLLYLLYLFIQSWIFWFEYLQVGEQLWFEVQDMGQYPRRLYQGSMGILLNVVVPITLAAAVPVELLLGQMSAWWLVGYGIVMMGLTLLTRKFWLFSLRKYASFSS